MEDYLDGHGPTLRVLRAYLGLSVAQCAQLLRVSPRSLQHMESGRSPVPAGVLADARTLIGWMESTAAEVATTGRASVRDASALELRAMGQALRDNPTLRIER